MFDRIRSLPLIIIDIIVQSVDCNESWPQFVCFDDRLPGFICDEGCGIVVAAGDSPDAQALIGHMVSMVGGATYAELCSDCERSSQTVRREEGTREWAMNEILPTRSAEASRLFFAEEKSP